MEKQFGFMKALKCRECGREYPLTATHVCEFDFGPLEVAYDYDRIKKALTREAIASRPKTMWRYRELLPIAGDKAMWTARVASRSEVRPGQPVELAIDTAGLQFFDTGTGLAIGRPAADSTAG